MATITWEKEKAKKFISDNNIISSFTVVAIFYFGMTDFIC